MLYPLLNTIYFCVKMSESNLTTSSSLTITDLLDDCLFKVFQLFSNPLELFKLKAVSRRFNQVITEYFLMHQVAIDDNDDNFFPVAQDYTHNYRMKKISLKKLFTSFPKLASLTLNHYPISITDKLTEIHPMFCLKTLKMSFLRFKANKAHLDCFFKKLPNLQKLTLLNFNCQEFDYNCLSSHIRYLELSTMNLGGSNEFLPLSYVFKKLKEQEEALSEGDEVEPYYLDLINDKNKIYKMSHQAINKLHFEYLFKSLPNLESLTVHDFDVHGFNFDCLSEHIEVIKLTQIWYTPFLDLIYKRGANLVHLDVASNFIQEGTQVSQIMSLISETCTNLEVLRITHTIATGYLTELPKLPKLKKVDIICSKLMVSYETLESMLRIMSNLRCIRLAFTNSFYNDHLLELCQRYCPQIENIENPSCESISATGLAIWRNLRYLKKLNHNSMKEMPIFST